VAKRKKGSSKGKKMFFRQVREADNSKSPWKTVKAIMSPTPNRAGRHLQKKSSLEVRELVGQRKAGSWTWFDNAVIGRGMCGKVYKAQHLQTKEYCAVKILDFQLFQTFYGASEMSREVFKNKAESEAKLLQRVAHKNVVAFLEAIRRRDDYLLCLEYVEGRELLEVIPQGGMDEKTARGIFKQICNALVHCHSLNVIHGDVKPENVIVKKKDVKLIDFGFACMWDPSTVIQVVGGSQLYAPPEPELTFAWDVWSLGVVLFAMLTQQLPFPKDNSARKLQPPDFPPCVSAPARDLLLQMLNPKPQERCTVAAARAHEWTNGCRSGVPSGMASPRTGRSTASGGHDSRRPSRGICISPKERSGRLTSDGEGDAYARATPPSTSVFGLLSSPMRRQNRSASISGNVVRRQPSLSPEDEILMGGKAGRSASLMTWDRSDSTTPPTEAAVSTPAMNITSARRPLQTHSSFDSFRSNSVEKVSTIVQYCRTKLYRKSSISTPPPSLEDGATSPQQQSSTSTLANSASPRKPMSADISKVGPRRLTMSSSPRQGLDLISTSPSGFSEGGGSSGERLEHTHDSLYQQEQDALAELGGPGECISPKDLSSKWRSFVRHELHDLRPARPLPLDSLLQRLRSEEQGYIMDLSLLNSWKKSCAGVVGLSSTHYLFTTTGDFFEVHSNHFYMAGSLNYSLLSCYSALLEPKLVKAYTYYAQNLHRTLLHLDELWTSNEAFANMLGTKSTFESSILAPVRHFKSYLEIFPSIGEILNTTENRTTMSENERYSYTCLVMGIIRHVRRILSIVFSRAGS